MRAEAAVLLAYNGLLVYLSLTPGPELEAYPGAGIVLFRGGFYAHLAAYLLLTVLWAIYGVGGERSLLASAATGALLEALQTLVPERSPSLSDLAANILGASLGYILVRLLGPGLPRRRESG